MIFLTKDIIFWHKSDEMLIYKKKTKLKMILFFIVFLLVGGVVCFLYAKESSAPLPLNYDAIYCDF